MGTGRSALAGEARANKQRDLSIIPPHFRAGPPPRRYLFTNADIPAMELIFHRQRHRFACSSGMRARVNFAYGQDDTRNPVLFDISIEIPSGQFLVMTGPENRARDDLADPDRRATRLAQQEASLVSFSTILTGVGRYLAAVDSVYVDGDGRPRLKSQSRRGLVESSCCRCYLACDAEF